MRIFGSSTPAPIPIDVIPADGSLCDSDLAVGLPVGTITINSNPPEGQTVVVCDVTYEFNSTCHTPAEGNMSVRRGIGPDEAIAATGGIIVSDGGCDGSKVTLGGQTFELDINHCAEGYVAFQCGGAEKWGESEGTITLPGGHTYYFCKIDPLHGDPWISLCNNPRTDCIAKDFIECIIAHDGCNYTASEYGTDDDGYYRVCLISTTPGPDGNSSITVASLAASVYGMECGGLRVDGIGIEVCDCNDTIASCLADVINANTAIDGTATLAYVALEHEVAGAAGNETIVVCGCGFVVDADMSGGEDAFCADSNVVVAMALATEISCHSAPCIEAAINPANPTQVLVIKTE